MNVDIDIAASDVEPGTIVLTIVFDGRTLPIPLKGADAFAFAQRAAQAYTTAFADQTMAAIAALEHELMCREHTDDAG